MEGKGCGGKRSPTHRRTKQMKREVRKEDSPSASQREVREGEIFMNQGVVAATLRKTQSGGIQEEISIRSQTRKLYPVTTFPVIVTPVWGGG